MQRTIWEPVIAIRLSPEVPRLTDRAAADTRVRLPTAHLLLNERNVDAKCADAQQLCGIAA